MKKIYLLSVLSIVLPLYGMKRGRDDSGSDNNSSRPPVKRAVDGLAGIIRDDEEAAALRNYIALCEKLYSALLSRCSENK